MLSFLLKNKKYEVLEKTNGDCFIKEIETNRYFFKEKYFASKKYVFNEKIKMKYEYKDFVSIILTAISFYLLFISLCDIINNKNPVKKDSEILIFIFISINIIAHEIGHMLALLTWGYKPGKIKLKFYYIFPLVSVDTSDIYIMPKHRGAFVCYAGIMVNIYICAIITFFFPEYNYINIPIFTLILFSLIPFSGVKTDGYNLFIKLLWGINDVKGKKSKTSKYLELLLNITLIYIVISYVHNYFYR